MKTGSTTDGGYKVTISAVWYGDRLESEANLPTDRLFTGQRYDDTGLYYYGARYYDPEIGRFISPDTIIPDPMNPQSLNRYSYCLNNPLKYTDPSGHTVTANGIDVNSIDTFIQYYEYIMLLTGGSAGVFNEVANSVEYQAYNAVRNASLEAGQLTKALEESSLVFNITFGSLDSDLAGDYHEFKNGSGGEIILNSTMFTTDVKSTAWALSHELVHARGNIETIMDSTLWEEAVAYRFQNQVGQSIGYKPQKGLFSCSRNPTSIISNLVQKTLAINLSVNQKGIADKAWRKAFYGSYYWDIGNYYPNIKQYPQSADYMNVLLQYIQ